MNVPSRTPVKLPPVTSAEKNHFGVDGISARYLGVISEIGDGASGLNGLTWSAIEPEPPVNGNHKYEAPKVDIMDDLNSSGRTLQLNILSDSDWAMQESAASRRDPGTGEKISRWERIKPEYLDDWRAFIRYLTGNYKIPFLQVGSEAENNWGSVDGYTESVCAAKEAVRGTGALILAPGFNFGNYFAIDENMRDEIERNASAAELKALAAADEKMKKKIEFVSEFMKNGKDCFDVLTLHLNDDYDSIPATVAWAKREMEANGYSRPIWSDDMASGPTYREPLATAAERDLISRVEQGDPAALAQYAVLQSQEAVKKPVTAFTSGVDRVFLSSDIDWTSYYIPIWRHQGLLTDRGARKPAFYSYQLAVSKLSGFTKAEKLNGYAYKFSFSDREPVLVLWADDGTRAVDISSYTPSKEVMVTHIVTALAANGSPVTEPEERVLASSVPVTDSPIFVEQR